MQDSIDIMKDKVGDRLEVKKHTIQEGVKLAKVESADGHQVKTGIPEDFLGVDRIGWEGKRPDEGFGAKEGVTEFNKKAVPDYGDALDQEWLKELNVARTDPKVYAAHLKELLPSFKGNVWNRRGQNAIRTHEGAAAVNEAIAFLESADPLPPFTWNTGCAKAAAELTRDAGAAGTQTHDSADGSDTVARLEKFGEIEEALAELISYGFIWAKDGVMQLLMDDGDPTRNNRTTIFNPDYKVLGLSVGAHKGMEHTSTIVLCGNFIES